MKIINSGLYQTEYTIKKSKFICLITKVTTKQQALDFIKKYSHPKATHNCYAYIINQDNITKYSDDGEPLYTAGFVMLSWLLKQHYTNIVVLTIRYYGHIPLGKPGLIKAYKNGLEQLLPTIKVYESQKIFRYQVTIDFKVRKLLLKIIKELNGKIISRQFNDFLVITFDSQNNNLEPILRKNIQIQEIITQELQLEKH